MRPWQMSCREMAKSAQKQGTRVVQTSLGEMMAPHIKAPSQVSACSGICDSKNILTPHMTLRTCNSICVSTAP